MTPEQTAMAAVVSAPAAYGIAAGIKALFWKAVDRYTRPDTVVDHAPCEGGCGQTVCCCPTPTGQDVCPGTVEQACAHHGLLCTDCAVRVCMVCRADYRADAGVSS